MELTAIIKALEFIPLFPLDNEEFIIFTDSLWAKNCASGLWKRKSNLDLWKQYDNALQNITDTPVTLKWVKAHNGNKFNEAADHLARKTARSLSP
jgi:ribonuclease HI